MQTNVNEEVSHVTDTGTETPAAAPAAEVKTSPAKVDSKQLRSLVDVITADVRRELAKAKKSVTPANVELLARVGERAAKFAIKVRTTSAGDSKAITKLDAECKQIESQLKAIKSIGSVIAAKRFFAIVDAAIDRLSSFAVAAVVAAV